MLTSPEPSSSISEKSSRSSFFFAGVTSTCAPVTLACVLDAKNLSDESLRSRSTALRVCQASAPGQTVINRVVTHYGGGASASCAEVRCQCQLR